MAISVSRNQTTQPAGIRAPDPQVLIGIKKNQRVIIHPGETAYMFVAKGPGRGTTLAPVPRPFTATVTTKPAGVDAPRTLGTWYSITADAAAAAGADVKAELVRIPAALGGKPTKVPLGA